MSKRRSEPSRREWVAAQASALSVSSGARSCQIEPRVVAEGGGVVAVLVTRGHLKDARDQQIAHRVGDVARIAGIAKRLDQPPNQADALIDSTQHQSGQVRGTPTSFEVGANCEARSGRLRGLPSYEKARK